MKLGSGWGVSCSFCGVHDNHGGFFRSDWLRGV